MEIIREINEARKIFDSIYSSGKTLGYVPTMGALHEGHGSLIKKSRQENQVVVVSIFVNPIQFGLGEDYEAYPRDLDRDAELCKSLGVDYIFHPSVEEMYPWDFATYVSPPDKMTNVLCGASRPGHFKGVTTVLCKFFSIIRPNRAYFGEKDIQQVAIVRRMVKDLNLGLDIVACPIVREEDGLAKSSRNSYLSCEERRAAPVLRRAILKGLDEYKSGETRTDTIRKVILEEIEKEKLARIDYVEILDFNTFDKIEEIQEGSLIAMAVYIGKTRLIDNLLIESPGLSQK